MGVAFITLDIDGTGATTVRSSTQTIEEEPSPARRPEAMGQKLVERDIWRVDHRKSDI